VQEELLAPMPLHGLTGEQKERYQRARRLLDELAIYDDRRAAVLLALTDDEEHNEFPELAKAGLPLAYCAGTAQIFRYAAPLLGLAPGQKIDREVRDYVFPQLREVGIVRLATAGTKEHVKRTGQYRRLDVHDPPKSPNSSYVMTDEGRALFDAADDAFEDLLAAFVTDAPQRRLRHQQALAQQAVATSSTNKHAALMRAAARTISSSTLGDGFEVVCIDDSDGRRLAAKWEQRLDQLNLKPDLSSRWPDVILANPQSRQVWFVDAVTSDGEIDTVRKEELETWSAERGWSVAGYTTAYECWADAARRQGTQKNLAVGTTIWIAEDGGKLFDVRALPARP
jgi:hypothetical protein